MPCTAFEKNLLVDCPTPMVAGVDDLVYLFNYDDIKRAVVTKNVSKTNLITGITLPSGALGIKVQGQLNSNEPLYSIKGGTYSRSFGHALTFRIFANSANVKAEIEKIVKGKAVAVVLNNHRGPNDEVAFEVLGLDAGLVSTVQDIRTVNDTDTNGAYVLQIATPESSSESRLPHSYLDTDYATTLAALEAMITNTAA